MRVDPNFIGSCCFNYAHDLWYREHRKWLWNIKERFMPREMWLERWGCRLGGYNSIYRIDIHTYVPSHA